VGVFSRLYNQIEKRPQWLDVAQHIYAFAARHGWDESVGGFVLRLSHDGLVQAGCESIYADAFAIYGMTELYLATGDRDVEQLLRKTADSALKRLEAPHDQIPHFPYPVPPGARVHGIPMIFSQAFWEAGQALNEERYRSAAIERQRDIFENFYRPDRDLLLERISADGNEFPPPLGTAVVPGHVIEDMWFQMQIARDRNDRPTIETSIRLLRRHLELGWDQKFGGILLAIDGNGGEVVGWNFADTKLWWPQTEAMYGLLLAHELSGGGQAWCMDWYRRVHEYAFAHYPVAEHGEWTQKLDRRGQPMTDVVALPVKDPFHLPRALILSLDVLGRLVKT
jgi:N-acylglucosamine 2-epimerase